MRIVDLSMTVEECESAPFAKDEYYFKLTPIVRWEEKGFVSNMVEMTVHAGTHIDTPHHFFRDRPGIEQLPLDDMIGEAVVLDLTFKGTPKARIEPADLERAGRHALAEQVADARAQGIDAWGWLPGDLSRDSLLDYARSVGAGVIVLPRDPGHPGGLLEDLERARPAEVESAAEPLGVEVVEIPSPEEADD